ncbi:MAG: tetratricopeptide repeat protein [Actinobacteria bacterium]|nr:tetratricopeptide repeat protein [Actinomycetota bacterium]
MDELFGVVNVPTWIWIDEDGMIVRPPEPAWPGKAMYRELLKGTSLDDLDPYLKETLEETRKFRPQMDLYPVALRDWATNGAESRYALTPEHVVGRSSARSPEVARAAAHFEIGQHLIRIGKPDDAVPHFREAHRLQPENWTYKRQAWSMAHPLQGPTDYYEGHWVKDVREIGYENYYPSFEP